MNREEQKKKKRKREEEKGEKKKKRNNNRVNVEAKRSCWFDRNSTIRLEPGELVALSRSSRGAIKRIVAPGNVR